MRTAARTALAEIRTISRTLFDPLVDADTLEKSSLDTVIRAFEQKTGTTVATKAIDLVAQQPFDVRRAALQISREALNNSARHAPDASRWISATVDDGLFMLDICDDGPGFAADFDLGDAVGRGHLGVAGMTYHAKGVGGTLVFDSGADRPTIVRFTVRLAAT